MHLLFILVTLFIQSALSAPFKDFIRERQTTCRMQCAQVNLQGEYRNNQENCINKCISEECYNQVYAANPPNPGEFNIERTDSWKACVIKQAQYLGFEYPEHKLKNYERRMQDFEVEQQKRMDQTIAKEIQDLQNQGLSHAEALNTIKKRKLEQIERIKERNRMEQESKDGGL